jgi:hypothetical protein
MVKCGEPGPNGELCERPEGHDGPHVVCSPGRFEARNVWGV